MIRSVVFAAVLLLAIPAIAPAADVAAGQAAFARCKICHSVQAGAPSPVGPNLHGVFGRKAGTAAGYEFSDAMKKSGIVWDEATMADYNRDPKAKVPGTKMVFNGVKNAGQLADLVAYLKQATQ